MHFAIERQGKDRLVKELKGCGATTFRNKGSNKIISMSRRITKSEGERAIIKNQKVVAPQPFG